MNVIISSIDKILNFGKANSLWPLAFSASCCGIELAQAAYSGCVFTGSKSDIFKTSPRQADLLICAGTITEKMAPVLKKLYLQMPEPKYVIAMGACAISGGVFSDSYSVIQDIDSILPVDIYLPGCPPDARALFDAIEKLKNGIRDNTVLKRKEELKAHRPGFQDVPDNVEGLTVEYFGVDKL